jgi:hypothetical protein
MNICSELKTEAEIHERTVSCPYTAVIADINYWFGDFVCGNHIMINYAVPHPLVKAVIKSLTTPGTSLLTAYHKC